MRITRGTRWLISGTLNRTDCNNIAESAHEFSVIALSPRVSRRAYPVPNNRRASSLCEFPPLASSVARGGFRRSGPAVPTPRGFPEELAPVRTQRAARRGTENTPGQVLNVVARCWPQYRRTVCARTIPLVPHRHETRLTCRRTVVKVRVLPSTRDRSRALESSISPTSRSLPSLSIKIPYRVVGLA